MNKNNESGLTLISVVMASAIGLIVVSGMISAIALVTNESRKLNQMHELRDMAEELKVIWSDPDKCLESFGAQVIQFTGGFAPGINSESQPKTIATLSGAPISNYTLNRIIDVSRFDIRLFSGDVATKVFVSKVDVVPLDKNGEIINFIKPPSLFLTFALDTATNQIDSCSVGTGPSSSPDDNFKDYLASRGLPNVPRKVVCNHSGLNQDLVYDIDVLRLSQGEIYYINDWTFGKIPSLIVYNTSGGLTFNRKFNAPYITDCPPSLTPGIDQEILY